MEKENEKNSMEDLKWNGSKLFGWGNSAFGELNPTSKLSENESLVNIDKRLSFSCNKSKLSVQGLKFKQSINDLAAGPNFVLALTSKGLESWGCSQDYQLGRENTGEYQLQTEPKSVEGIKAYHTVHSISCGEYHAAAATNEGLFVWGTNNFGQLGLHLPDEEEHREGTVNPNFIKRKDWSLPVLVPLFKQLDFHISFVACGDGFTLALNDLGELYAWGINTWGQLGTRDRGNKNYPVKIDTNGVNFKHLSAGMNHSVGIDSNGAVYSWGLSTYGQLGLESWEESKGVLSDDENLPFVLKPTRVNSLSNFEIVQTVCGSDFTLFRDSNGKVFACGYSTLGQCGQGNRRDQKVPVPVSFGTDMVATWIAAGSSHSVAVSNSGQVWTWGSGTAGQLGHSSSKDEIRPKLVESLANERVDMVVCGSTFTLALVGRSYRNIGSDFISFDDKFCDIKFNFGNSEVVPAHKIVLWSKNQPFFEAITRGNESLEVQMDWISRDLFKIILEYLYSNKVPRSSSEGILQELEKLSREKPELNLNSLLCRMEDRPDPNPIRDRMFSSAFGNSRFSDVELIVDGKRFATHKVILSSRSLFFKAMFGGGMKEAEQKEVNLPEIRAKVFELMLEYIYTGEIKDLTPTSEENGENVTDAQDAIDLLQLASEYNMMQLVGVCEVALQGLIQLDNVVQLFSFSTFISASSLREACIQFILDHMDQLEEELKGEEMWQTQEMKDRVYASVQFGKSNQVARDKNQKWYEEAKNEKVSGGSLLANLHLEGSGTKTTEQ
eukprot:TRINITY_DN2938_c0_g1_i1.p1 TRINITY_DN2938_c0_g1~~TRINITY_DN2938_c0_g1_i1.p1  ORF type:complete len:804 (+),score=242.93 TRINITY_DN2938_c0_g1_i1:76-2412(+)